MKLEKFIADSRGRDVINGTMKIRKDFLDSGLDMKDDIPIDHEAVNASIRTSDEFDVPPTWVVDVEVDLSKLI